jgi:cysteine-rich repeat protein
MCAAGPARDCNDTNSCTTDSCDETNDTCVNQQSGACCGDGSVNPGEECDDGNQSNTDACLNTCVPATCGDGFVRTGVEQCDLGASNSDAPNATCRTDCTPRRCGDGIVDTQTEQCDDGGTASGDGCSATCGAERPATALLIPGKGNTSTDCGLEWAFENPVLDRRGIPSIKQSCVDGDPACDHGTTPGECTIHVWVCANNTDSNLPLCTPGAAGIGNVAFVETRKPSSREASLRPIDALNRQQILVAADAAETTTPNSCGPRLAIRVPLRGTPAVNKGVKVLKLAGDTDKTIPVRDSDVLKLFCLPATP